MDHTLVCGTHIRVCNSAARRDLDGNPATKTQARSTRLASGRLAVSALLRARSIFEEPPTRPGQGRGEAQTDHNRMQDEGSEAALVDTNTTATAATNVGSGDASSPGFSARAEALPGRGDRESLSHTIVPRARHETGRGRGPKRQKKLTAGQTAANGDVQQAASLHTCKTCGANFNARNALMKHVSSLEHQEWKGMPGRGAKQRRRNRRAAKQRVAALAPAAEMPPSSEAGEQEAGDQMVQAEAAPDEPTAPVEQRSLWGDWDPLDNPAISHGYTTRAGYEAARRAEQLAMDRTVQSQSLDGAELPDYSDVASDG